MTDPRDRPEAGSLKWLLSLDGEPFIHAVFETMLDRSPDPLGAKHYLSRLNKQRDKRKIISDIYNSPEAKSRPQRKDIMEAVYRYQHPFRSIFGGLSYSGLLTNSGGEQFQSPDAIHHLPIASGMGEAHFNDLLNAIHGKGNVIQDQLLQIEYRLDNAGRPEAEEVLGDGETRYLLNLSTSNHWRSHAVGIVRVEREIATYLKRFRNVDYVLWDSQSLSLKKLPRVQADRILTPEWCDPSAGLLSYDAGSLAPAAIRPDDTYISLGLDWDHAPTSQVLKYLKPFSAKVILTCYDTVPTQFPEFLVRDEIFAEFRHHLVDMAHGATKVWAISQATKRDLATFWDKAGLERDLPEIFTVPLASYTDTSNLPPLNQHEHAILRETFRRGEYVLYVSSVEPRKNHKLLLDVWRELWMERGEDCPQLVYVGMLGWGSGDMLQRISRMPAYVGGKINGLHRVSDNLLAHLYRHCSFTVFPSLYEGWGLAATEAMGLGKVCVVADNSSLGEATQGIMPAYHPLDFPSWKSEIERLVDDLPYRRSLEHKIACEYRQITWQDVGQRFCDNILQGEQK